MLTAHHSRTHFFNETFFDIIDTEEKAYWLGFLYADGANCDKANNVSLSLTESDAEMLIKLQKAIGSDHKIYVRVSNKSKNPVHTLLLCSKYLCSSLSKQGCTPRKSLTLQFPTEEQVPKHLLNHFVRGYFDGDGSFYVSKRKGKTTITGYASVVSSEAFCTSLKTELNKILPIGGCVKEHKCKSGKLVYYFNLNGASQVISFMDWMYNEATVYLPRKRERYHNWLTERNKTMPLRLKYSFVPHCITF